MLPSVTVVVPTHDRPDLLRHTLAAIAAQEYDGPIETLVVFDGSDPEPDLARDTPLRQVRVMANAHTPGLAGARNTGIEAAGGRYIAFCDDDDCWLPTKLRRQLAAAEDGTPLVTCAIVVDFEGRRTVRLAGATRISHDQLLRSRMSMLHSSTLVFEADALRRRIGLVDEQVPGSQNEDWDLLLRASAVGPIVHVDEPLVVVRWGRTSYFSRMWESRVSSLHWMLDRHPDIADDRRGLARVYGQLAFGAAAMGERREAWHWAGRTLRLNPLQWRALAALPVAVGAVSAESVLDTLHRVGRGV